MKVTCKQTTSIGFDLKEVTTVFSNDFDYSFGGHGIELGEEYIVMGITMYANTNCLYYLIDTNGKPDWYPYLLFDVSDRHLPSNWFVMINGKNSDNKIHSIWGFDELCNKADFYDKLLDREETEMRIYFKRKMELEAEYSLLNK